MSNVAVVIDRVAAAKGEDVYLGAEDFRALASHEKAREWVGFAQSTGESLLFMFGKRVHELTPDMERLSRESQYSIREAHEAVLAVGYAVAVECAKAEAQAGVRPLGYLWWVKSILDMEVKSRRHGLGNAGAVGGPMGSCCTRCGVDLASVSSVGGEELAMCENCWKNRNRNAG